MTNFKKIFCSFIVGLFSICANAGVELVCTPSGGCNTVNDLGTGNVIVNGQSHTVQHPGNDLYIIDGKSHMINPNDEDSVYIDGRLEYFFN